jgi:predicted DNA-binding transcriptional regulator AlpA
MNSLADLRIWLEAAPPGTLISASELAAMLAGIPDNAPRPVAKPETDTLLTIKQAAERLNVNRRWLYRHAATLPFTRKLTEGTLRFSEKGLERWKDQR